MVAHCCRGGLILIARVDHINIATIKLEETKDFFVHALKFEVGPRPAIGGTAGYWLYSGGQALVHLQQARGETRPTRDSALNHIAFRVGDIAAAAAHLTASGVAFREFDDERSPLRQLFLEDPNGVVIEINAQRGM